MGLLPGICTKFKGRAGLEPKPGIKVGYHTVLLCWEIIPKKPLGSPVNRASGNFVQHGELHVALRNTTTHQP